MSAILEKALLLADAGFYLFPLRPNGRQPLFQASWPEFSTCNKEVIESWFVMRTPNIGINCGKSGILAIDVDVKENKVGMESFLELRESAKANGDIFPVTWVVTTPSGGRHLYYRCNTLGNSQNRLGMHIDTKCINGYVIAPGSVINDRHYVLDRQGIPDKNSLPELPAWLHQKLKTREVIRRKSKPGEDFAENAPTDILWARDLLKRHPPAVENDGGDAATYKLFCQLRDHGLARETAIELVGELWNPRCSPPWDMTDLEQKANNAYQYAKQPAGGRSVEVEFGDTPPLHQSSKTQTAPVAVETPPVKTPLPKLLHRAAHPDEFSIPKRQWVFGNLALRKQVSIIVAPGGAGKSTLTLGIALSKASGQAIMGMDPYNVGRVAVYNNEDNLEEMNRRETAARKYYGLTYQDLADEEGTRLFLSSGEERMFRVIARAKDGLKVTEDVEAIIQELIDNKIEMLIIDPLAETHAAKENDNDEMIRVGGVFRHIAQKANCAVILVHHTRKLQTASSEGHNGNMDSMRGASSLTGLARVIVTFLGMDKKKAAAYRVEENERWKYVLLEHAKGNMTVNSANHMWYEKVSQTININDDEPEGESVGVLKPVKFGPEIAVISDKQLELLYSVAAVIELGPVNLNEVAAQLAATPLYSDKKPASIAANIRRVFEKGDGRIPFEDRYICFKQDPREIKPNFILSLESAFIPDDDDLVYVL